MSPSIRLRAIAALIFTLLSFNCGAAIPDGAWRGHIDIQGQKLPLVFHLTANPDGTAGCTLDSPLQGVKGLTVNVTLCTPDSIALAIPAIGASYNGSVTARRITGTFRQSGFAFPLILEPEQPLSQRRPQTPRPPYPYTIIDTVFTAADGVTLAATLTIPDTPKGQLPAVVMVTGSGPQNRDEEMFDHRPFAVIADYLTRNGIASLRYDDRGTAASGGTFATADIDTFRADALAAFNFLRSAGNFGPVGIIGHSEGGTLALMLAADSVPGFAISLAGAAVKGKDLILEQNRLSCVKMGLSHSQTADVLTLLDDAFDYLIAGNDPHTYNSDDALARRHLDIPAPILASLKRNLASSSGSYFPKLLGTDPSQWLHRITCPVLAVNGSLDSQVLSGPNLAIIRECVPSATVKEYPGLNHLLQHASTGDVAEYSDITETISPQVLADVVAFISSLLSNP